MSVSRAQLTDAVAAAGVAGNAVCLHGSLRSFGWVEGGARSVLDAFLAAGCTVLAPTFSDDFAVDPPPGLRPSRNGWTYSADEVLEAVAPVYTTDTAAVDADMGAIPAAVLAHPHHVRGNHPLNSFAAVGPEAEALVSPQRPLDVYAPLRALVEHDGMVVLIGVGLDRMTLLHHAEQLAGREPFRRWALSAEGVPAMVQAGGCSEGFGGLGPALARLGTEIDVGPSHWNVLPSRSVVERAAEAFRSDPAITHCGDPDCERCRDAALGGPILSGP